MKILAEIFLLTHSDTNKKGGIMQIINSKQRVWIFFQSLQTQKVLLDSVSW